MANHNHNITSLCCKSSVTHLKQPLAEENEATEIWVCNQCNSEAPNEFMFRDLNKVPQFFIDLHAHKTNNHTIIARQELTPSLKQKPYYIKTK